MKKHGTFLLAAVTIAFVVFTLGFVLGRSGRREAVSVSVRKDLFTLPPTVASIPETTEAIHYPLDINSATKDDLQTLPGIGEVLSQRIIDYRTDNGSFASTDQLMDVYGIGETLYKSIQNYVTVLN